MFTCAPEFETLMTPLLTNCKRITPNVSVALPWLVKLSSPLLEEFTIRFVCPPSTHPEIRRAELVLAAEALILLLLIDKLVLPAKRKPAVLFVPVPVFPLTPTPTPAVVFVKRATTVAVGTVVGDQLPTVSQAPLPATDCQVFVVCPLTVTCSTLPSTAAIMSATNKGPEDFTREKFFMVLGPSGQPFGLEVRKWARGRQAARMAARASLREGAGAFMARMGWGAEERRGGVCWAATHDHGRRGCGPSVPGATILL